jgi:flagellar hook-associated protein 3 FlgL
MRVTNKMLSNNFLRDMNVNIKNLSKLQQQMASGKEISRPSDDPFKISRSMQLHSDIDANKMYNDNIKDTINWLDTTDTSLGQAGDVLQRVRELLVSAGNATYDSNQKKAIKDEINQKVGQIAQIMNTNFDGRYLFGGTRGTTKPMESVINASTNNTDLVYHNKAGGVLETDPKAILTATLKTQMSAAGASAAEVVAVTSAVAGAIDIDATTADVGAVPITTPGVQTLVNSIVSTANINIIKNTAAAAVIEYNQMGSKINVEISQGVTIDYNVNANDMLQFTESGINYDLRAIFTKITNHLDGKTDTGSVPITGTDPNPTSQIITTDLQAITDAISNTLKLRSEVGAKQNRMDGAKTKNEDESFNMTDILSHIEDIDITQKTMEYYTMQTVYMASLQTSAKIIQPSLLDYLR